MAGSDDAEPIRQALIDYRATGEAALRERFERAKAESDLPGTADCATLAAYVMAVAHGLAVQAKAGFRREVLEAVAEQALAGWPAGAPLPVPEPGQVGRPAPLRVALARPLLYPRHETSSQGTDDDIEHELG